MFILKTRTLILELIVSLLLLFLIKHTAYSQLELDEKGWSIVEPSADSRVIYVSYSEGNDTNDGLSESSPKKTIEAADELMRNGYPDFMLLKRGDVWPDFEGFGRWKSGRSAKEPIVVSYYGDSGDRPVIKTTNYFLHPNGYGFNYQAFIGLDLYNSVHDPDSPDFDDETTYSSGIRLIGGGKDIIFEDCKFRFMQITTTTYTWENHEDNIVSNFKLRRCIITDNWAHNTTTSHDSRPQGYYTSSTYGILIEECVFDHNGWSESFEDANANMYNHNIYMSTGNHGPIIVKGNIISQAAANGLQLRSGGIAEDNLFVRNAIGMNAGYTNYPEYYNENTYVRNNVVTEGRPQIPNDYTNPQSGALWGIWKQLIDDYYCYNNIVCNVHNTQASNIRPFADQNANEFGKNNIGWNWVNNNVPETDPGWLDPDRNVGSYYASLGNDTSFAAFIEAARNREVKTWPYELTAYAVNEYIREGFSIPGNTAPSADFTFQLQGQAPVKVEFTNTSTDADGDNLSYTWIFQDFKIDDKFDSVLIEKEISTDKNPTYTYFYPGKYEIVLTVNDGNGGIDKIVKEITISGEYPPVALLTADIESGDAPLTVKFDGSSSYNTDGNGILYHFDFGNGVQTISENPVVSFTFEPGIYEVSLFITKDNDTSNTDSITITVEDPTLKYDSYTVIEDAYLEKDNPNTNYGDVANSRVTSDDRYGIFKVDFSSNSNAIESARLYIPVKYNNYRCSMFYISDDGWKENSVTWNTMPETGSFIDTTHYDDSWAYFDVTNIIINESDKVASFLLKQDADEWQEFRYKETSWATPYLYIESRKITENTTPVAIISTDTTGGSSPLTVNFDATGSSDADGDPLTYSWDFGDGSEPSSDAKVSHVFTEKGIYQVTLSVDDGKGAENASSATTSIQIFVDMEYSNINLVRNENGFVIAPVPAKDYLYIRSNNQNSIEKALLQIYSTSGQQVFSEEFESTPEKEIDISTLQVGTYILKITTQSEVQSCLFIKE